jgi:hypothetical protein
MKRMVLLIVAVVIVAVASNWSEAAQITGGFVDVSRFHGGIFPTSVEGHLFGPGFAIDFGADSAADPFPRHPGESIVFAGGFAADTEGGTATIGEMTFNLCLGFLGSHCGAVNGEFNIGGSSVVAPPIGDTLTPTLLAPLFLQAGVGSPPEVAPVLSDGFSVSGIATITLFQTACFTLPMGTCWQLREARLEIAATPEPATALLVISAVSGIAMHTWRRRRDRLCPCDRGQQQEDETPDHRPSVRE